MESYISRASSNQLSLQDKFTFGQYKGISVGLVYLLNPSYFDWLIKETDKYLIDIEDAMNLKVIDVFNWSYQPVMGDVVEDYNKVFSFEELIYAGFKTYTISEDAIEKNRTKARGRLIKRRIFLDQNKPFFYTPYAALNIVVIGKVVDVYKTNKNQDAITIEFDNTGNIIKYASNIENAKVTINWNDDESINFLKDFKKNNCIVKLTIQENEYSLDSI